MNCPLCGTELMAVDGDRIHENDSKYGVTVWCPAAYPTVCPAQEVMGHGNNVRDAYAVVLAKYKKGTDENSRSIKRNGVRVAEGTAEAGEGGEGVEGAGGES